MHGNPQSGGGGVVGVDDDNSTRTTAGLTTGLVAAPAADADGSTEVPGQSSTSTTSSSSSTIIITATTNVPPGSVQIAQAQDSETTETTQAADTVATSSGVATAETSPPLLPESPAATPLLTTIESPQRATGSAAADATDTTSPDPALNTVPALSSNAVQSTVAVAGGVIGGAVAISILAFFIWWWRRRLMRKRRSTLLTPLDAVPSNEKGSYVISRRSIGPTPVVEKVRVALGQNFKKIRGHIRNRTAPSVNLDRGPSQFLDPPATRSRANSAVTGTEPAAKDRLRGWWSALGARVGFNQRNKTGRGATSDVTQEKKTGSSDSQPDFLTLLNMDDGELDREAQRRRANLARTNGSVSSTDNFLGLSLDFGRDDDPFSDANALAHNSAKPAPLAVGGSSSSNPFSDANAIRDPAPSLPKAAATYVPGMRRSRTNSTAAGGRQLSTAYYSPANRDSVGSLRSLATATTTTNQRNKFRSDPFDLERPELLGTTTTATTTTITSAAAGVPDLPLPLRTDTTTVTNNNNGADVRRPTGTRTRAESTVSRYSKYSKYSSGVSAVSSLSSGGDDDGWSDPGPDVGPAAARSAGARWPGQQVQGQLGQQGQQGQGQTQGQGQQGQGQGARRLSGGSLGSLRSVGKAM
ncbi:6069705d-3531-4c7a-9a38-caea4979f6df [Thermothielavioides terrestris]|uniref:6069705d-3531-4c7a-9a38-caea4979f6df n=1 Tax=Thermothielavioides terrestris TaxID=2587410 RepID=A0A3S4CAM9_9PEZI|nr:6069705d-3531-4c7a-9a38-caea4979f6df [Thermothielavioides terrestris]